MRRKLPGGGTSIAGRSYWVVTDETVPLLAAMAFVLLMGLWIARDIWAYRFMLDDANLAFHEAGHMFYAFLGEAMALYGGTVGQLTFPLIALGSFALKRQWPHAAVASAWLAENCFNIARYMADARAQELPLVGGGEHDWTNIFMRWHVLRHDVQIAYVAQGVGWFILAATLAWLVHLYLEAARMAAQP